MLVAEAGGDPVGWCTAVRNVFSGDGDSGILDVRCARRPAPRSRGGACRSGDRAPRRPRASHRARLLGGRSRAAGPCRAARVRRGSRLEHVRRRPRTVQPMPVPDDVTLRSFAELDDPRPLYELDVEVSGDVPGELAFDSITLEQWSGQFWRTVAADMEASLAAYVDGEASPPSRCCASTGRVTRPEQPHRDAAPVPGSWPGAAAQVAQPASRGGGRRDRRVHRERRDQRGDAGGERALGYSTPHAGSSGSGGFRADEPPALPAASRSVSQPARRCRTSGKTVSAPASRSSAAATVSVQPDVA